MSFPGFNYQFEALTVDPKENELNRAFSTIFQSGPGMALIPMLRGMFPVLRFLVRQNELLPTVQLIVHV